jgi:uncharacterized protein
MKYLIWLLVALAAVVWLKRIRAGLSGSRSDVGNRSVHRESEAMQQCARCGVHIPASEAVIDATGTIFCCAEHRAQHAGR